MINQLIFGRHYDFEEATVESKGIDGSFQIINSDGLMLLQSFHGIIPKELTGKKVTIKYSKSRVDQRPRVIIVVGARTD